MRRATAILVGILLLVPGIPAHAGPTCFGKQATKVKRTHDQFYDFWIGTPKADVIIIPNYVPKREFGAWVDGLGGDDLICGGDHGRKEEWVFGGDGDDRIKLGASKNSGAVGGDGNDTIIGGKRDHVLFGGASNDALSGKGANDDLYGDGDIDDPLDVREWPSSQLDDGTDVLSGGLGNDYLDG